MNVYDAIMKAADQIERYPDEFNVMSTTIPTAPHCGTPGCALGWVTYFLGISGYFFGQEITRLLGVTSDIQFYDRMDRLSGERPHCNQWTKWAKDAALCARTLRLYAAKYHAPKRTDSELVADLMTRVMGERIPEDVAP